MKLLCYVGSFFPLGSLTTSELEELVKLHNPIRKFAMELRQDGAYIRANYNAAPHQVCSNALFQQKKIIVNSLFHFIALIKLLYMLNANLYYYYYYCLCPIDVFFLAFNFLLSLAIIEKSIPEALLNAFLIFFKK